jgi:hypothetical protein
VAVGAVSARLGGGKRAWLLASARRTAKRALLARSVRAAPAAARIGYGKRRHALKTALR